MDLAEAQANEWIRCIELLKKCNRDRAEDFVEDNKHSPAFTDYQNDGTACRFSSKRTREYVLDPSDEFLNVQRSAGAGSDGRRQMRAVSRGCIHLAEGKDSSAFLKHAGRALEYNGFEV